MNACRCEKHTSEVVKRHLLIAAVLAGIFLTGFWLLPVISIPAFENPAMAAESAPGILLATISIAILVSDVVLPVPSSVVMLANGVFFGFLWGSGVSLLGAMGASLLGFRFGRVGAHFTERRIPASERARFDALLRQWGILLIAVTRPVPIVAETVSILAGTSSMRFPEYAFASLLGALPTAVLYAAAGSGFRPAVGGVGQIVALIGVALLAFGGHAAQKRFRKEVETPKC